MLGAMLGLQSLRLSATRQSRSRVKDGAPMIRCACGKPTLFVLTGLSGLFAGLLVLFHPTALAAQTINSWFDSGSAYPRRAMSVHRHSHGRRARATDDAGSTATAADNKPSGPLFAVLSLSDQR